MPTSRKLLGDTWCLWHHLRGRYLAQVLDTRVLSLVEEIATEEEVHTLTFDKDWQRLYVFLSHSGRAAVYDEG